MRIHSRLLFLARAGLAMAAPLLIVGCAAEARPAKAPQANRDLTKAIEAATLDEDANVRREALLVLRQRGRGSSMPVVGKLVDDPDEMVRRAAILAVGNLMRQGGENEGLAAGLLSRALHDGSWENRAMALHQLAACPVLSCTDVDAIRGCLEEGRPSVQLAAALALIHAGHADGLEEFIVNVIDKNSGPAVDWMTVPCFDCIQDRKYLWLLEVLVQSTNAQVQFRAKCAQARLVGNKKRWNELAAVEVEYSAEQDQAKKALEQSRLEPVLRSEVLQKVRESRLVLFGETHEEEGPLRVTQLEVLHAFVKEPAFEAIGYEPSAESAQRSVLEEAKALGLRVIPLETNWRELSPAFRLGARDVEAAAAIEAFLGDDPSHRMIVLRGEGHVMPDGFLVRRLRQRPLILLSGALVAVPLCQGGVRCAGSTFRVGRTGDTYLLPCDYDVDFTRDLERWLSAR